MVSYETIRNNYNQLFLSFIIQKNTNYLTLWSYTTSIHPDGNRFHPFHPDCGLLGKRTLRKIPLTSRADKTGKRYAWSLVLLEVIIQQSFPKALVDLAFKIIFVCDFILLEICFEICCIAHNDNDDHHSGTYNKSQHNKGQTRLLLAKYWTLKL